MLDHGLSELQGTGLSAWTDAGDPSLLQAFSCDLQQVFTEIESMDVEALVGVGPNGSTVAATMAVDDARVNGLLLKARTCQVSID